MLDRILRHHRLRAEQQQQVKTTRKKKKRYNVPIRICTRYNTNALGLETEKVAKK